MSHAYFDPFGSDDYVGRWLTESSARAKRALMRDANAKICEARIRISRIDTPFRWGAVRALDDCQRILGSYRRGDAHGLREYNGKTRQEISEQMKVQMIRIARILTIPRISAEIENGCRQALSIFKNYGHIAGADGDFLDRVAEKLDGYIERSKSGRRGIV